MDVYHPVQSNGLGLIVIEGSGWYMPQRDDAQGLKNGPSVVQYGRRFAEAGYTASLSTTVPSSVRYPAAIEDAQRAVRFIRHNAGGYEIDGRRLGSLGSLIWRSSPALLGTLAALGIRTTPIR